MCRLTILIPLLDDSMQFEDTLASVLQSRPERSEVVVVHDGSYNDPYELAAEVRFVTHNGSGLVGAINAGCEAAKGYIINLVLPGITVSEGWTERVLPWFDEREIASVAPLLIRDDRHDEIVSAGLRYGIGGQRIVHGVGTHMDSVDSLCDTAIIAPTLAMGFYRRSVLTAIGGFSSSLGEFCADIDAGLTWKALGLRCSLEPACMVRARLYERHVKPSFRQGREAERLFWRHAWQFGWLPSLSSHSAFVACDLLRRALSPAAYLSALGRMASCCEFDQAAHQRDRLRMARKRIESQRKPKPPKKNEQPAGRTEKPPQSELLGGLQPRRAA